MRIAIVTDAWRPQVNGVVTTLANTVRCLEAGGHSVKLVTPQPFKTIPAPTYPSIRLAIKPQRKIVRMLNDFAPDAVHIATEGPLGLATRRYCTRKGFRFTTSYHTRFAEYIRMRVAVPLAVSYAYLGWFHAGAQRTLVSTESQRRELASLGFENLALWPRGVDTQLFQPRQRLALDAPRPIALYAGRVAKEKNLEAFLSLELPGTKFIVGDGPQLAALKAKFPNARFTGFKHGEELAAYLASADVFVFPSRSDTFGLVMLEAMACGVPVAAYPVPGPVDVITNGVTGALSRDLRSATLTALTLDGEVARRYALERSWQAATRGFLSNLSFDYLHKAGMAAHTARH